MAKREVGLTTPPGHQGNPLTKETHQNLELKYTQRPAGECLTIAFKKKKQFIVILWVI